MPSHIPGMPEKELQGKYVNHRGTNAQANWITTLETKFLQWELHVTSMFSSRCLKGKSLQEKATLPLENVSLKADPALLPTDKPVNLIKDCIVLEYSALSLSSKDFPPPWHKKEHQQIKSEINTTLEKSTQERQSSVGVWG